LIPPAGTSTIMRLGPGALVLVPAISLMLLFARPVWDFDIFWQLKLGELILARGGPVWTEPFAAAHLGEPLQSLAWAGQALYAALRLAGGWPLLRTFDALCWLGGFWAAGWLAHRRGASALGVALGLALGLMVAIPQASLRPQSLAALCFGLLLVLSHYPARMVVKLVLGALLLLVWQNLHPSVAVAVIWLGSLAGFGWLQTIARRGGPLPWEPTALSVLAALAMFATPEGLGILSVSAVNAALSRQIGVSEWLPLWAPINFELAMPVAITAVLAGALVWRSGRFAANELLPVLVLFALAAIGARFVLFWAIALVPVVARAAPDLAEPRLPRWWAVPTLVVALAGLILPPRFAPQLPLQAVAALRDTGVAGTVYSHFPWGGPLVDAGYPAWRVAYDGRYYRYASAEWDAYFAASRGEVPLSAIEARWRPSAFLLDNDWNAPLIAALRADPRWRELPGTGEAVAFVPARNHRQ